MPGEWGAGGGRKQYGPAMEGERREKGYATHKEKALGR